MTSSDLGMNIAKFRRQAGLSQSELGKCLNVSAQAVSRWERGGVPDAALLPQIASSLGVLWTTSMDCPPYLRKMWRIPWPRRFKTLRRSKELPALCSWRGI